MAESFMAGWDINATKWETRRIRKLTEKQVRLQEKANSVNANVAYQQAKLAKEQRKGLKAERVAKYGSTTDRLIEKMSKMNEARKKAEAEAVSKLSELEQENYYREKLEAKKKLPKKIAIGVICYIVIVLLVALLLTTFLSK